MGNPVTDALAELLRGSQPQIRAFEQDQRAMREHVHEEASLHALN